MLWPISDIADAIQNGFIDQAEQDDRGQVVRGFDALDEVRLHPLIQEGLRAAGYGVYPEERFPGDRGIKKKSGGQRCDLVLTAEKMPLAAPDSMATLFDPPDAVALSDAFWLEVKVVAQFTESGEPNAGYSAALLQAVRGDVSKLAADPQILHAGLLLVMFVADRRISEDDLRAWQGRCLDGGYPIGSPAIRQITITDRIGHCFATVAVYPVHHL